MELSPSERTELLQISSALNKISTEQVSISKNITKSDFRRLKSMRAGFTDEILIEPHEAAQRSQLPAKPRPCSCKQDRKKCLAPECSHHGGKVPPYDHEGSLSQEYMRTAGIRFIQECNSLCACDPSDCLNRVVQKGSTLPKEIFSIAGKGLGVRTLVPIKKGQFIGMYSGRYKDADAPDASDDPCDERNRYLFEVDDELGAAQYSVDAYKEGNVTKFMNHHCKPNVIVEFVYGRYADLKIADIAFFAKDDIPVKRELCFSYGSEYLKRVQMLCRCSSRTHIFEPVNQEYRFVVDCGTDNPRSMYPVQILRGIVLENAPSKLGNMLMYEVRLPGLREVRRVLVAQDCIQALTTSLLMKFRAYALEVQGEHEIALQEIREVLKTMDPKPFEEQWELSNLDLPEVRMEYEKALRTYAIWKPSIYFTEKNYLKKPRQRLMEWRRRRVSSLGSLQLESGSGAQQRDRKMSFIGKGRGNRLRPTKKKRL